MVECEWREWNSIYSRIVEGYNTSRHSFTNNPNISRQNPNGDLQKFPIAHYPIKKIKVKEVLFLKQVTNPSFKTSKESNQPKYIAYAHICVYMNIFELLPKSINIYYQYEL